MNSLHYAVVVGVQHYATLTPLNHAVNDAVKFGEWLVTGGGVPKAHVRVLTSAPGTPGVPNRYPAMDDVYDAVLAWRKHLTAHLDGDPEGWRQSRLYVFVSGHGVAFSSTDATLLAPEWDDDHRKGVSLAALKEFLVVSQEFREVVLLADCCRDEDEGLANFAGPPPWQRSKTGRGRCVFAFWKAAAYPQQGFEAGPEGEHSYFTQALLDGLRGAAAKDGRIDTNTLALWVEGSVPRLAAPREQTPEVPTSSVKDAIVFVRPPPRVRSAADGANSASGRGGEEFLGERGVIGLELVPDADPDPESDEPDPLPAMPVPIELSADPRRRIRVFDLAGDLVASSNVGRVRDVLSPGTYRIQLDQDKPRNLKVGAKGLVKILEPLRTIAPVPGSAASNENHQGASQRLAKPKHSWGAGAAVAVAARYPKELPHLVDRGLPRPTLTGLVLGDGDGNLLGRLDDSGERPDARFTGWSAGVPPGPVTLTWTGDGRTWRQHLWAPAGYVLYLFAPVDSAGRASRRGLSIHLRPMSEGVTPFYTPPGEPEELNRAAEYALAGLERRVASVYRTEMLLAGKWKNPMAGILGAHALLFADTVDHHLVDEVLGNLERLVPGHPDVAGLCALAALARGTPPPPMVAPHLPMLARSWEGLLLADATAGGGVIPAGSQSDRMATRISTQGPWLGTVTAPQGREEEVGIAARVRAWGARAGTMEQGALAAGNMLPRASIERLLRS